MRKYLFVSLFSLCVCTLWAGEYIVSEIIGLGEEQSLVSMDIIAENLVDLGGFASKIRIYDAAGKIVPWHRIQKSNPHYNRRKIAHGFQISEVRKVKQDDNSTALQVRFELQETVVLPEEVHLTFHSPMRNFEQQVTVFGIDENGQEISLLKDGFLFDSSENLDARNLDVQLKPGRCRKFRLLLAAASVEKRQVLRSIMTKQETNGSRTEYESVQIADQPFQANHLELWSEQSVEDGTEPCWLELAADFRDAGKGSDEKTSVIEIQPNAYPVNQLYFSCAVPNFSRKIRVFIKSEEGVEQTIAKGLIRRLELGFVKDESRIQFPAISDGKIFVELQDNDNEPLPLLSIKTQLPAYQLQFLLKKSQLPIHVTAEPDGQEPQYDMETFLALGKNEKMQLLSATLKDFQGSKIVPTKQGKALKKNLHKGWLYGAIALAVIAMALALVKLGKSSLSVESPKK